MKQIPANEITYHPMSNGEPDIRLFWWRGGLYRAVKGEKALFYQDLFNRGIIQTLIEKGFLVDTQLTPLQLAGYELILEHRCIPFVSYSFEWCGAMLKDAALLICDLQVELDQYGLTLKDPHSWNVLFDGPKPVYVDLGSIAPADQYASSVGYDCFCRFTLYPLIIMSQGHARIARWLLHDATQGISEKEFALLTGQVSLPLKAKHLFMGVSSRIKKVLPQRFRRLLKSFVFSSSAAALLGVSKSPRDFWMWVRKRIEGITIPQRTEWSEYYEHLPTLSPSNQWKAKQHSVYKVLSELRPITVLDIGSNRGWYSQLAASLGSRVVAFDTDEGSIIKCYLDAKETNLSILPLVINFTFPSPSYGVGDKQSASATERLKCELVLCLSLIHHLVFKQNRNFEMIVEALAAFSEKWLLVEFIPNGDRYVSQWWSDSYSWYTLDGFIKALERRFDNIGILPSHPDPRTLLLCRRKAE